jgi:hypothetical protein
MQRFCDYSSTLARNLCGYVGTMKAQRTGTQDVESGLGYVTMVLENLYHQSAYWLATVVAKLTR